MALACTAGPVRGQELPLHKNTHTIMHFTPDWVQAHHQRRAKLPVIQAPKDYQFNFPPAERHPGGQFVDQHEFRLLRRPDRVGPGRMRQLLGVRVHRGVLGG